MQRSTTDGNLIYVVDDETDIRRLVSICVSASGYQVKGFSSGFDALCTLKTDEPDLIILDVVMPGPNGLEVARRIRRSSQVPILMLTVHDGIATKVAALDAGADDYITKPFQAQELLARVRAILRRTASAESVSQFASYCFGRVGFPIRLVPLGQPIHRFREHAGHWPKSAHHVDPT